MIKAIWNGQVLAQSRNTVIVDRKHYFPFEDLNMEFFEESEKHTTCSWKGEASYYHLIVNDKKNVDAAWYYPNPLPEARNIQHLVAFSYIHGVDVIEEKEKVESR